MNISPLVESSLRGARQYLVWLLARREYAVSELKMKALQKGYSSEHIDQAMDFLQKQGLQDDTRYAGMKARQVSSRWGNRRIEQVLKTKQINGDTIKTQLECLSPEEERAWEVIARMDGSDWSAELSQKVWRRLASRGFGPSAIKSAISRLRIATTHSDDIDI